jgi:PAS domain-containing protein
LTRENLFRKNARPANQQLGGRRLIADLEVLQSARQRAEEALQQAYRELEPRIDARTTELMAANALLQQEIEERKKAEGELKRTKEYLENVIGNSVDAIGIVDRHGRFILWNRRAEEIYGFQFDELGLPPENRSTCQVRMGHRREAGR